ncbi:HEPN domain-containing protein [Candidatus Bathyarchaeota archaeon]|nr:HEPN domain-containing protein [Candidatus Bathyarchaeota archaeon]
MKRLRWPLIEKRLDQTINLLVHTTKNGKRRPNRTKPSMKTVTGGLVIEGNLQMIKKGIPETVFRKTPEDGRADAAKAVRSILIDKLEEAGKTLENDLFDSAAVLSYTAMFRAARALLLRDGIIEKSRLCLAEYAVRKANESLHAV